MHLLIFDFEDLESVNLYIFCKQMTSGRLLKNLSDLYAYSFWKVCQPVRLLKTVRLLETLE